LKEVLKAGHAFKGLASDVQHRRRTGAASRLRRQGKREIIKEDGGGKVVQPWVKGTEAALRRAVSKVGSQLSVSGLRRVD
jgi:hypothetical protein